METYTKDNTLDNVAQERVQLATIAINQNN